MGYKVDVIGTVTGRYYHLGLLLARAGEGAVYRDSSDRSILIKIFDAPLTSRSIQKLELLCRYSPQPAFTALPLETVVDASTGAVVGFLQPFFDRAVPLTNALDNPARALAGLPNGIRHQVKLCRLLCDSMARLHAANLVMGDVSDTNFLIGRNWLGQAEVVYVIDCNSLQLTMRTNQGNECFVSGVATEAFLAPEIQSTDWSTSTRTVFSDSFGLAVACWLVLFNGSHPFSVASPGNVDVPPLGQRIERRQFPFAPASPLPAGWTQITLDPSLSILPPDLRDMFFRVFSTDDPRDRPTAEEWVQAFGRWEANPSPRLSLRNYTGLKGVFSNPLAYASIPFGTWGRRGLLLGGLVLLPISSQLFELATPPSPEPNGTRSPPAVSHGPQRTLPTKPSRPTYVDRDIFPEPFWIPPAPNPGVIR